MEAILRAIQQALALANQLQGLIPEIEANFALVKDALGSHDQAAVSAAIDHLHVQTNNATAALAAMRDPAEPVAEEAEDA